MLQTDRGPVDLGKQAPWQRTALGVGRTFQNARLFRSLSLRDILRTVQHDSMKRSGLVRSVIGTRGARAHAHSPHCPTLHGHPLPSSARGWGDPMPGPRHSKVRGRNVSRPD